MLAGSVPDVADEAGQVRVWRPSWPCPVGAILRQQRRGFGDPTYRIEENFDLFGFELTDDEVARITALDRSKRTGPDPDRFNPNA